MKVDKVFTSLYGEATASFKIRILKNTAQMSQCAKANNFISTVICNYICDDNNN